MSTRSLLSLYVASKINTKTKKTLIVPRYLKLRSIGEILSDV